MKALKRFITITWLLFGSALLAANEQDVIASVEYFYAPDGTLTGRAVNGIRQNFEYDKRGQLLAVKDANGRDLERYTYDPAGNRLSKTVYGITTTYTYDEANQLKTSTVNGETTHYRYDAAGRLVQAGDKAYYYFGANDKVTEVRQGDKVIAEFDYFMDGQIASAKYPDREESFTWDGLALVQRNEVSYINEPYVTGGNPILNSRDGVMFNDMLGSTLNIGKQPVSMTSFGETEDSAAFFTGKPMITELGFSFLFRDYNPSQGKWTSSDPLGYPDGWNNFTYCNNSVIKMIDSMGCFWEEIVQVVAGVASGAATGAGAGALIGSLFPIVGTSAGAISGAVSGAISGAIAALSNSLSNPPETYVDALKSGALDGALSGAVAGVSPVGPKTTIVAGSLSSSLSAGVNSEWNVGMMVFGGILGGAYGHGATKFTGAVWNNVLSVNGITVTNAVLGYMRLFDVFPQKSTEKEKWVNE